jgi:ribosomal biogenesis protein LAS1
MARYIITPWRQQSDLLTVRAQLYRTSRDPQDERRQAIDRVMAWKLRGNLPHAVESTALLIDAQLHHQVTDANSQFSIRAVYSAAFCRFVTGFCDIGRAREGRLEPSSMLEIAKHIGMPVEFVALRHEATHEELPSLPRLVQAVHAALQWLWQVYWSRLEEPTILGDGGVDFPAVKEETRRILKTFRSSRREAFRTRAQKSPGHLREVRETTEACAKICAVNMLHADVFTGTVVEEKVLLPADREYAYRPLARTNSYADHAVGPAHPWKERLRSGILCWKSCA